MMKLHDTLYIVIPACNEERNIKSVIDEWYSVIDSINDRPRIVVSNDGSMDRTKGLVKEISDLRIKVRLLAKKNGGHGSAVLHGYKYAIENKAAWVFQTDADGQTFSADFDDFWNLRNQYDAVLGMRSKRGDGR